MIFLLDYNRKRLALDHFHKYDDAQREQAKDDRLALELSHCRAGIQHEIVILEAPNEDALRRSHARYFGTETIAKLFQDDYKYHSAKMNQFAVPLSH